MLRDEVKAFADAGQHSERKNIDLHNTKRVDIVLVPFNKSAVIHCRITKRHNFVKPPACENKAADMLRKMAWKAEQFFSPMDGTCNFRIMRIKPCLANMLFTRRAAP